MWTVIYYCGLWHQTCVIFTYLARENRFFIIKSAFCFSSPSSHTHASLFVLMYPYPHMYTHMSSHVNGHTHAHVCTLHTSMFIITQTHIHIYFYSHVLMHKFAHAHLLTNAHAHIVHVHIFSFLSVHTCTHTTHTHIRELSHTLFPLLHTLPHPPAVFKEAH